MTKPAIHMNGTSAGALREGYCAALEALSAALDALANAAPNARDYYVQPAGTWERARDEHEARCAALVKVRNEVEELAIHCADAEA